jgi:hypothetical protein
MSRSGRPPAKCFACGSEERLEPVHTNFDVKAWFAKFDEYLEPFMPDGREQPPMPPSQKIFDD